MQYDALHIDSEKEQEYQRNLSFSDRLFKWLTNLTHFKLFTPLPYGRVSLINQLNNRKIFPSESWIRAGYEPIKVMPILQLLMKEFRLPNCNFIPNDPIEYALISDFEDYYRNYLITALNKSLKVAIKEQDLCRLVNDDDATIADLCNLVMHK